MLEGVEKEACVEDVDLLRELGDGRRPECCAGRVEEASCWLSCRGIGKRRLSARTMRG